MKEELRDNLEDLYLDEQDFEENFEYVFDRFDDIESVVELNRVVVLERISALNINNLGNHWVDDPSIIDNDFIDYLRHECSGETIIGTPYIISANFRRTDIDIETSIRKYMENPNENEIYLKSGSSPISAVTVLNTESNDTHVIDIPKINRDISLISKSALSLRKKYWEENNITPWEINNGLCEDFAMQLKNELQFDSDTLYDTNLLSITNTGDEDWDAFYEKSTEGFNIRPTRGLNNEEFLRTAIKYADQSHVWLVYEKDGMSFHFDAANPEGVDNPMKLNTFDKYMKMAEEKTPDHKITDFLRKNKVDYEFQFKHRMNIESQTKENAAELSI